MEFVKVPAGQFILNHDDIAPTKKIYLDEYEIGQYPVTNAEYCEFSGGIVPKQYLDHPVVNISWYAAMQFCFWMSNRTNTTITLPSEAQYRKAARGGIWLDGVKNKQMRNPLPRRKYPWGDTEPNSAFGNYAWNGTTSVSKYACGISPYGCYDMLSNVWHWCQDWYTVDYLKKVSKKNPVNEKKSEFKVVLGKSWRGCMYMSIDIRMKLIPSRYDCRLGFRCVRLKGE